MYRRCHFLEECPYLKYNQGRAFGDPVMDEKTGKMVYKREDYKDTSKLRSVLFSTMRREVAYFSKQYVGGTQERGSHYHQVIHVAWFLVCYFLVVLQLVYDFQKGEGNFSLLSTFSEASEYSDELNIQTFRDLGFELPSQMYVKCCNIFL